MKKIQLFIALLIITALCKSELSAQNEIYEKATFKLTKQTTGHYTLPIVFNEQTKAEALLESGIHAMLIDSAFAFNYLNHLNLELTPCTKQIMNLGGTKYRISHRAQVELQINPSVIFKGELFLLADFHQTYEVALPIQKIYHAKGKRCINLDLRNNAIHVLASCDAPKTKWDTFNINTNTYLNMPAITSELNFKHPKYDATLKGNFNLDLGNASLLFIFNQSKAVQDFLNSQTNIEMQKGYDKKGNLIAQAFLPKTLNLGNISIDNPVVAITKFLPKFTTDGCFGIKFFEKKEVIFDFDNNKLYIKIE